MAGTIVSSSIAKVAGAALTTWALVALCTAAHGQQPNRADCVTRFHDGKRYVYCESDKEKKERLRRSYRGRAPYVVRQSAPPPPSPSIAPPPPPPSAARPSSRSSAPAARTERGGSGRSVSGGGGGQQRSLRPATDRPAAKARAAVRLQAVRALIEPGDMPPREVAGYGIVAFTTRPLPHDIDRYKSICEAYKATLLAQSELPANTPLSEQMITYWPIAKKDTPEARRTDCAHLVANYALRLGLDAIEDADKQKEGFASRRGPFLIAWAPSESRLVPDAVVLVMDLSDLDSQRSFAEVFQDWREQITDNPELWVRGGFNVEAIRRIIRDTFDRYGDGLLRLITKS
jgi:hypothetical protein